MKKRLARIGVYVGIFILIFGGVGIYQFVGEQKSYWNAPREQSVPSLDGVKVPEYDPNKPTVAVVLGSPTTEVFDFVVPYEMFVMTKAYNVFAVAPNKKVTTLTGGLDVVPHYSFKELDQLLGKSPDLIVTPYMPMGDKEKYKPVRKWLQKHANTNLLSICGGAANLADAGLLKGKTATIHWEYIDFTKLLLRDTNWVRGQRYVEDGNIVGSAGLTSGIDAVLYVISKDLGENAAKEIAMDMNYPSYHHVKNPKVKPYYIDHTEVVYILNQAFQWKEKKMGVLLYDGMEDGALASIFDTYSASGTSNVYTVNSSGKPIVTKHNLNLVPRNKISNSPKLDRMIVSGIQAKSLAKEEIKLWNEKGKADEVVLMHRDSPDRFIFDAPLEDLANDEDKLTAIYGAKRLEYRADLNFDGAPFSYEAFGNALALGVVALLIALYVDKRFILNKKRYKDGITLIK